MSSAEESNPPNGNAAEVRRLLKPFAPWLALSAVMGIASGAATVALLRTINGALNQALLLPAMRDRLAQLGSESLAPSTPAQTDAFGQKERARWVPFIRSL